MTSNYRNSSIELLRLLLMVLIIIHHCIVHGLGLIGISDNSEVPLVLKSSQMGWAFCVNAFCICAVNCFVLISGYFRVNANDKRFINLILSLLFYTIILNVLPLIVEHDWKWAIKRCLFLSHSPYWFVIDYLFLMVFTPMINLAFEKLPIKEMTYVIVGLLIISCYFGFVWEHPANVDGYTLIQFITIYCVGRIIALRQISFSTVKAVILYSVSSIVVGLCGYVCYRYGFKNLAWRSTYYNNPFLILSAIGLFFIFKNQRFHSIKINKLAKHAFGIYLFQSSVSIGKVMYRWIRETAQEYNGSILLIVIVLSISTAIVSLIFDQSRVWLLNKIQPTLTKWLNRKLK